MEVRPIPSSAWGLFGVVRFLSNLSSEESLSVLPRPAGQNVTVEIGTSRAVTSLSYDGKFTSEWLDGNSYPEDYRLGDCEWWDQGDR